jgi:hypothetical protein
MPGALLGSGLFALSQGHSCEGTELCHWCGGPCCRELMHDEPPPLIGVKRVVPARFAQSPYYCPGCWLWSRKRVTVWYLGSSQFKDLQHAQKHSWYYTEKGAWAVRHNIDHTSLFKILLDPPRTFCLALVTPDVPNYLQCHRPNDVSELRADTPLSFTVDNTPLEYTVYELGEALRHGVEGKTPGVRTLIGMLGKWEMEPIPEVKARSGRPAPEPDGKITKKILRVSGKEDKEVNGYSYIPPKEAVDEFEPHKAVRKKDFYTTRKK